MPEGSGTYVDDEGLDGWLDGFGNPADNAEDVFNSYAETIASDARANAPWADRTGLARTGIIAEVDNNGNEVVLSLAHTVEYGIWLETIQNGRFAILLPTLEKWALTVFDDAGGEVIGTTGGF